MLSKNKVELIGHLGKNPELVDLPSGGSVIRFSVATNERFTTRNGEEKEHTEWHNVEAFGSVAQSIIKNIKKGDQILLVGKIKTDSFTKNDERRYYTKIIANSYLKLAKVS